MGNQFHAGTTLDGDDVWHTDSDGLWWSGNHGHRTTEALYSECLTTLAELLQHYPNLAKQGKINES